MKFSDSKHVFFSHELVKIQTKRMEKTDGNNEAVKCYQVDLSIISISSIFQLSHDIKMKCKSVESSRCNFCFLRFKLITSHNFGLFLERDTRGHYSVASPRILSHAHEARGTIVELESVITELDIQMRKKIPINMRNRR